MSKEIIKTSTSVKYFLEQNIIPNWTTDLQDQHDVVEFLDYFWMILHPQHGNLLLWNKKENKINEFMSEITHTCNL